LEAQKSAVELKSFLYYTYIGVTGWESVIVIVHDGRKRIGKAKIVCYCGHVEGSGILHYIQVEAFVGRGNRAGQDCPATPFHLLL
jgi:hypothetical protein